MFTKLFGRALRLEIEGHALSFESVADFEFALAGRTEVPWQRVTASLKLSAEELKEEASGIKKVEKRFVDALSSALEDRTTIGRHFREMDVKLFSQDHQWRSIVTALTGKDAEFDEYKRVALVKYLQYLASRQEVVHSIYKERRKQAAGGASAEGEKEAGGSAGMRETVIFDLNQMEPTSREAGTYARLPKGEAIEVSLEQPAEVGLLLSKQRFKLVGGEQCYLVDENGADYLLHEGRNTVGRDTKNDVVVNPAYRDVSRTHLVVELDQGPVVRLTDLSSHGTFVASEHLDQTVEHS